MKPRSRHASVAADPSRANSATPGTRQSWDRRYVPRKSGPNPRSPSFTTELDPLLNPNEPNEPKPRPSRPKRQSQFINSLKTNTKLGSFLHFLIQIAAPPPTRSRRRGHLATAVAGC